MAAGNWRRSGGENIARIRRELEALDKIKVRVGWMESARYNDGKPVAGIAVVQEFGSEKMSIPPRSFMRSTQAEKKGDWDKTMKSGFSAVMNGTRTSAQLMEAMGAMASGDVRKKITQIFTPPLATSTLKARARRASGSAGLVSVKPLNDSGYMLATLTHVVTTEGDE
ncbi:hypothetical protein [Pectobacterium parmentieri]|uniref:hypothetical protein n=1 Tax=Pectobacterium parmentieri TaxID=1905730 RepID=UPI000EAC90A4|nr:hypothetical protein [Pectobacterium parmentieri]AYH32966.1 hypothetical protein C5E19_15825 [Pectobacterium parmentieri]